MPGFLMVLTPSNSQGNLLGAVVVRHLWIRSSWEAQRRHREAAPHCVAVTWTSARRVQAQGLECKVREASLCWTEGTTEGLEGQDFACVVRALQPTDVGAGMIPAFLGYFFQCTS